MKHKTIQRLLLCLCAAVLAATIPTQATSLNLNFSSTGGTILDTNGVATGFTARMDGSGANITGNDSTLKLNTGVGVLQMLTSPGADLNGQTAMADASIIGINLSTLGYSGSNDFTATARFINITNAFLQPDQLALVVGTAATNNTRAGFINFSGFNSSDEGYGVNNLNGFDSSGRYFGAQVGGTMTVEIKRTGGTWSIKVNNIDRMPNSNADGTGTPMPPTFLDTETNLFVGVLAMDVFNDSPWYVNLDNFSISVSGNSPPTIAGQPQTRLVNEGNPASFSVTASDTSKAPIAYQWRRNGSNLAGQTNSAISLYDVSTANAGSYTVVLTNSLGSITSSVAPLYVVLPSGSLSLNFSAAAGGVKDTNGVGTGLPTRLPGTGTALSTNDGNLFLNTGVGTLDITTTSSDFNGGNGLDVNESLGVSLASLGFTGSQDLNATALFPLPFPTTQQFDQFGVFVGIDTNALTRSGSITFANKERYSENIQTNNAGVPSNIGGQYFGFGFDSSIPMTVLISRTAGVWHYYIDTVPWDVFTQPTWINNTPNLTAGVFAQDVVNGIHKTVSVDSFKARVFNAPQLTITASGGNQTITWNVAGPAVLQSNTNLTNPTGWTTVAGSPTSPFVTPLSKTGQKFYRLAF